ncbi:hypothetical protein SAMD00019534_075910 [Acytostelium subglobosum LB1]|uniref:hypothetical protein n=1 Tax=Acytostelium subglobosum LB1 TaxID=1410327 RepID=UPI000644F5AF|nr:hypothetical protein SAMD00019534_075910 [Acytostelium subglobosum LB1]GAM24416.1 hypothetical protein SAMD00019534_075910 [Acytostelium subglobosum LB1]|eukprot:XP_012752742.1 hypothetical protein SAMD00019534_075910 [Acytostelium subglobosum LB1]
MDAQSRDDEDEDRTKLWKNTNLFSVSELSGEVDDESDDDDDDQDEKIKQEVEDDDEDNDGIDDVPVGQKRKNPSEFNNDNNNNNDDDEDEDEEKHDEVDTPVHLKSIPTGARKYMKGNIVPATGITNPVLKAKLERQAANQRTAAISALKAEILVQADAGFIQPDEGERTYALTQKDIVKAVDMQSKNKVFDLTLDHGPYTLDYSRDGKYLLMAGAKGHVASLDWRNGKKITETHLSQPARHACFLHNEQMFAVAQKKYTYIYSSAGVQLHQLKAHFDPKFLSFLPYHFLLVSATNRGKLVYEDISIGRVQGNHSFKGTLSAMCQNRSNAVIQLGYTNGSVDLWVPKAHQPVVKILAHKTAITSLATSLSGNYLVTAGLDRMVKVFDLRNSYEEVRTFSVKNVPTSMALSDTNVLAIGNGRQVSIWQNPFDPSISEPYLIPKVHDNVTSVKFCPFEDVMTAGHGKGISSMLVPGSGMAQYDSLEADPYATKKMKSEAEVHALLEKIPYDMISLDPNVIGTINQNVSTEEKKHKREVQKQVDKNRVTVDHKKVEAMEAKKRAQKEAREREILEPTKTRSALSRFEQKKK